MMAAVTNYLAVRRTTGFALSNAQYLLRSFAAFAAERQEQFIRTATVIDWASQALSLAQRHARYQAVCKFARYVRLEDLSTNRHRRTTSVTGRSAAYLTSIRQQRSIA